MERRLVLVVCLGFLAVASSLPVEDNETSPSQEENTVSGKEEITLLDKLNSRCSKREASACLMLKLVTYVNRLIKKADIPITESMQVTQVSEVASETLFAGARESKSDEEAVGDFIADKLYAFVKSRALRWNVFDRTDLVLSATPEKDGALEFDLSLRGQPKETGRGKMKNMGPLIAAGAMKMGMIGILAFKALALLVGKALLVSKLAFLLAAIIGLKKLFSQQKHVTYEVVAHPHHAHHEHHGGGGGGSGGDSYSSGWGRSIEVAPKSATVGSDPHSLAYKAHAQ